MTPIIIIQTIKDPRAQRFVTTYLVRKIHCNKSSKLSNNTSDYIEQNMEPHMPISFIGYVSYGIYTKSLSDTMAPVLIDLMLVKIWYQENKCMLGTI